mgnify:CR=1 FL=1
MCALFKQWYFKMTFFLLKYNNKNYFLEGRCFYNPGSAVVYQHDDKYYVTGVVNSEFVNLDSNQCDIEDFMLYTDISRYMNSFILTKLSTH